MVFSNITNEYYHDIDVKDIFNTFQAGIYVKFGCKIVNCYWIDETKTLVHTFFKHDTFRKAHNLWCLKKLANMTKEEFEEYK